jgi:LacI family transcriptional regulator
MKTKPELSMSRAQHVALIVDTAVASGRKTLAGIAEFIRDHGTWITYHEPRDVEHAVPKWLKHWEGDGIIVRSHNRRILNAVLASGLPAVDVLGEAPHPELPLVHVDNRRIAKIAADHLVDLGLSSFGFCHRQGQRWSHERLIAFTNHLAAEKYRCSVHTMRPTDASNYSWEDDQKTMAEWLASLPKPVGVMVCSDCFGNSVVAACRRAGISVPEEVAIIGVDNDEVLCSICEPTLTSVIGDHEKVGYTAAVVLTQMMSGQPPGQQVTLIPPRGLVVRRSTNTLALEEGIVVEALRLIRVNACHGITAADVIQSASTCGTVLKRKFRQVLGRSIHEEITRVRIEEALFLLRESDLHLSEIAERTGFKRQEYMGMVLKKS